MTDGFPPEKDATSVGTWLAVIAAVGAIATPFGAWVGGLFRDGAERRAKALAATREADAAKEKTTTDGWREIADNLNRRVERAEARADAADARADQAERELSEAKVLIGRLIEWGKGMQDACEAAVPRIRFRPWSEVTTPADGSAVQKALPGGK